MCGRYAASREPEDLAEIFEVEQWDPEETLEADWNIAPTKPVYAVLDRPLRGAHSTEPVRQLRVLRWGLVPSWAKNPDLGVKMINARSESVTDKPAFRRAFASRRCLLPADGYFEWVTPPDDFAEEQQGKKARRRKQPYFITPADGSVMAMAGLFEFWRDKTLPDEHPRAWWTTCTVLTAAAQTAPFAGADSGGEGPRSLAAIHPRMPVVITPDRFDAWLDPACDDADTLQALMAPPPAELIRAYPVSFDVSNVRNNTPRNVEPLAEQEPETLF